MCPGGHSVGRHGELADADWEDSGKEMTRGNKAAGENNAPNLEELNHNNVQLRVDPLGKGAGFPLVTHFKSNHPPLPLLFNSP